MDETAYSTEPTDLSLVVVHLLKGPLYRDTHEKLWNRLPSVRPQVDEYVSVLGLMLIIDDAEGYSYLRSQPIDPDGTEFPRLIARHSLSFRVSVLLALLRRRLAEFDATSSEVRLVLSRDQIVEMLRLFLPDSTNDSSIKKVCDLGFLRQLRSETDQFEVRRILKAYIDGQWLSEFDARLSEYLDDPVLNGESA
jgi:hypothetical protein